MISWLVSEAWCLLGEASKAEAPSVPGTPQAVDVWGRISWIPRDPPPATSTVESQLGKASLNKQTLLRPAFLIQGKEWNEFLVLAS